MPFIYRDLGGDVENDFVDLDMDSSESASVEHRSVKVSDISTQERLGIDVASNYWSSWIGKTLSSVIQFST